MADAETSTTPTATAAAAAASPTETPAQPNAGTPPAAQAPTTTIDAALAPLQTTAGAGDDGLRKRPRDARLIHMILANQGVAAYQERVPLQLLDFCYRYTSATLQDALHLTAEFGQPGVAEGTGAKSKNLATTHDFNAVSLSSLRLSIASRTHYQLSQQLPKDHLIELATEKNRIVLPPVGKGWGMPLPPERYCLSGVGWGLNEEWESEGEEEVAREPDTVMDEGEGDDEDGGRMEDLYGEGLDEMDTKED